MNSELYSLSKLFTENLLRIPDYQRGYSWTKKHLSDFWNDLTQLGNENDHYTGVLTLEPVEKTRYAEWKEDLWIIQSKRYCPYYVVDGQQRLTTALVLLQCILERAGKDQLNYTSPEDIRKKFLFETRDGGVSRSYIFGYEKDNPSYEFLKQQIFLEHSEVHSTGENTIYTENLANAKAFFSEKLKASTTPILEETFIKLTQHCLFNIYVIAGSIDVFVAFETMNNRGKLLSKLELLKNRLIYLSTKLGLDRHDQRSLRSTINESWKTVYHFLGKNKERPLSDDHFLWTQFCIYAARNIPSASKDLESRSIYHLFGSGDDGENYLLDQHFVVRNITKDKDSASKEPDKATINETTIKEYARHMKCLAKLYYEIWNPEESSHSESVKTWLARLRRLGMRETFLSVAAIIESGGSQETISAFLKELERYIFLSSATGSYISHDAIFLGLKALKKDANIEELIKILRESTDFRVKKGDGAVFNAAWANERGHYGWRHIKYFLFEYEEHLRYGTKTNREKIQWETFASLETSEDHETVEHIYPQRARETEWSPDYQKLKIRERTVLRNSIGNLLAVSRPRNASLSNKPFDEKRDGTDRNKDVCYRTGSYSEIEVSRSEDWRPRDILDRGLRLLSFLEERWGVSLGTESRKIGQLKLGFLIRGSGREYEDPIFTDMDEKSD